MPSSGVARRPGTTIRSGEYHLRVPRTARYHVLGDPSSAREVWFVLHGYRQLAGRFITRFEVLPGIGGARAVVAPEALSRFYVEREVGPHGPESRVGATWMTRADREYEIRDYVEYLDRLAETVLAGDGPGPGPGVAGSGVIDGGGRRLVVLGFSQGSETASRWAVLGRVHPAELVLWGGGLAADLESDRVAEALGDVDVRFVVGGDDSWAGKRAAESLRLLEGAGIRSRRLNYEGGHEVGAAELERHWALG